MHGKGNQGVSLQDHEAANPIFKQHIRKDRVLGPLLSFKKSGKCPFLDSSTYRCRIYEQRPEKCREFTCIGNNKEGMLAKTFPIVKAWI
jgi:Fe-S-cluster containining protein